MPMSAETVVRYVGDSDFHDAVVVRVEQQQDTVSVLLKAAGGSYRTIRFGGVESLTSNSPNGMIIYAISEMTSPTLRKFIFVNSDDSNDSALAVVASDVSWS
jgi:hypothetical protein